MVIGGQLPPGYCSKWFGRASIRQWCRHTRIVRDPSGFKCRSSNKFLPKPWFLFTRAVFVSQILPTCETRVQPRRVWFYRVTRICSGSSNELSICPTTTQGPRHCYGTTGVPGILRIRNSLCRSLNPAQFVSAYTYGLHPPDFRLYRSFLGALDPIRSDAPCSTVELRAH